MQFFLISYVEQIVQMLTVEFPLLKSQQKVARVVVVINYGTGWYLFGRWGKQILQYIQNLDICNALALVVWCKLFLDVSLERDDLTCSCIPYIE